jgi:hypothetical protein
MDIETPEASSNAGLANEDANCIPLNVTAFRALFPQADMGGPAFCLRRVPLPARAQTIYLVAERSGIQLLRETYDLDACDPPVAF